MLQKIAIIRGFFIAVFILAESWFLINVMFFGRYVFMIFILIIFIIFFLSKIRDLEKKGVMAKDTLKKIKEDYLKVEEEKNKILAIVDNFQDGILMLDKDNKISYINFQAEKILDIQYKKIINKSISDLKSFPNTNAIVALLLQDAKDFFKQEVQVNENLILKISVNPLIIEKAYAGKFVILHDITRGKIVEKTKTDFVSLTAHQLIMPLSTLKLSLEMLLNGSFGKISKKQRNIFEKTYQRNKMLIYLVNDLLDMAKLEEKGYAYNWELVDIEDLIKLVISSDQDEIKTKKIKFKLETTKINPSKIILDREKIFLVIKNIFDNAIKYTPMGGNITISFWVDKKELIVKIQDSGIGIPEDQKNKLFTKFFRGINAIKMEIIGSGLGLFIAQNIIEAHHGKIWFESKENEGSSFFISLPIKEIDPSLYHQKAPASVQ